MGYIRMSQIQYTNIENQYIQNNTGNEIDTFSQQLQKRASSPEFSIEKLKELYIESLTPKERKAYEIARSHLGMSFTLEKSVGFLEWKSTFVASTK
jgi:hypothetical protein